MKLGTPSTVLILAGIAVAAMVHVHVHAPVAHAVPAPEVEYTYDVVFRRHYAFPNNDAFGYGYGICDKVRNGVGYPQVMAKGEERRHAK
jgi:hypothetical protein